MSPVFEVSQGDYENYETIQLGHDKDLRVIAAIEGNKNIHDAGLVRKLRFMDKDDKMLHAYRYLFDNDTSSIVSYV